MVDNKTRSEEFKERYGDAYGESLKQIDLLNKRFAMALNVMDEVDAKMAVDQQTKEAVRYEMAVRFGLEKHKAMDIGFSQISSVLDRRGKDGRTIQCPDCKDGKVDERRCKSCGGIGKMINHNLSLDYKMLYGIGDLTRLVQAQSAGAGGNMEDVVKMSYEQMMKSGLEGDEAKEALGMVAQQLGLTQDDTDEFIAGYETFVKENGKPVDVKDGA